MHDLAALRLDVDRCAERGEQRAGPRPAGDDDDVAADRLAVDRDRDPAGGRRARRRPPRGARTHRVARRAASTPATSRRPSTRAPPGTNTPWRSSRSGGKRAWIARAVEPLDVAHRRGRRAALAQPGLDDVDGRRVVGDHERPAAAVPEVGDAERVELADERGVVGGAAGVQVVVPTGRRRRPRLDDPGPGGRRPAVQLGVDDGDARRRAGRARRRRWPGDPGADDDGRRRHDGRSKSASSRRGARARHESVMTSVSSSSSMASRWTRTIG